MVKFSVVIPYYKAGVTIQRTLASVLGQTYRKYEVLLIDDDSRDDIAEVAAEFVPLFAKRGGVLILIRSPRNGGPSVARNLGWNRATGDYIAFLDSDDAWHPQKLELCASLLAKRRTPGVFHGSCVAPDAGAAQRFVSESWRIENFTWREMPRYKWLIRNRAATPSIIVSRAIGERFDPTLRFCEDHELWLRITFQHGPFVALIGPPLTQLSRPSLTSGGQSSRIHQMRLGEVRMYAKFCYSRSSLLPLLPLLIGWSVAKYLYFLLRRKFAAFCNADTRSKTALAVDTKIR